MPAAPFAALLAALVLAGCATPGADPAGYAVVDPPVDGGGFAECPPRASLPIAVSFRADATNDTRGLPPGVHRVPDGFLWVFASYEATLREDRVSRVNEVNVSRDAAGLVHVCTRVDLSAPVEVDREPRTYGVGVRLSPRDPLPVGPTRVVVNWVAGCPCETPPTGNATALFE